MILICDAYNAMTEGRPFRAARSNEQALEELRRGAGTQFDPELVKTFAEKVIPALERERYGVAGHYGWWVTAVLDELTVADAPSAWRECGFTVEEDFCVVGEVRIRFAPEEGRRAWLAGACAGSTPRTSTACRRTAAKTGRTCPRIPGTNTSGRLLSRPRTRTASPRSTTWSRSAPTSTAPIAALQAAGLDLRRVREEPTPAGAPRQAFFRLGATILEVVQEPAEATARHGGDRPAFFWGLAFVAPDLERTVAYLGEERVSEIRPAVQPGRRIATLRRGAGLSVPVALMSPRDRESAKSVE